jgi:formate dehydrogenase iron-sulfur subunit
MAEPMGFFTDTSVCIGCKACEVACKEWNQLPSTNGGVGTLSGDSYDNTASTGATCGSSSSSTRTARAAGGS